MCGVCGRLVDRVTGEEDAFMDRMVFVASCHGERERIDVSFDELNAAPTFELRGIAFATKVPRLPR